jgi:recombinational DNA repair protein (RecF pathway)
MLITSRAIILSIVRYADDALIAEAYTEQQGRVGFLVKISRSARAAVRHTLFQPLAVLELTWEHRSGGGLSRPKAARSVLPFTSLPYDPYKSAMALFIAEFLHHALRSEPVTTHLYNYIEQSINWLDTCTRNFSNFHLVFLVRLTFFLGITPNVDYPERYKFFDRETLVHVACTIPQEHIATRHGVDVAAQVAVWTEDQGLICGETFYDFLSVARCHHDVGVCLDCRRSVDVVNDFVVRMCRGESCKLCRWTTFSQGA